MRVLVCGGRNYEDYETMATCLSAMQVNRAPFTVIIHGKAKGADELAGIYARRHNIPVLEFPADWKAHGLGAGPRRNKRMLVEGKPDLVMAFPGNKGTRNMIAQAEEAGVEVWRFMQTAEEVKWKRIGTS